MPLLRDRILPVLINLPHASSARRTLNGGGYALALILFYGLTAFLALNRLVLNIGAVVSSGPLNDYSLFTWNYWWIGYALNTLHIDPYLTNYILYPFQHNLAMHTLAPILYPFYAALHPFLGDPATLNVVMWGSFTATGSLAFLCVRRFTGRVVAALLGGLLYMLSPALIDHAVNFHANLWFMFWFPALLLLWDRVAANVNQRRGLAWAIGFGLALWGLWLTDLEFLVWVPWLLIPFGILTLVQVKRDAWRLAALGVLSLVIMGLLLLIAPLPALLRGDPLGGTSPADYLAARQHSLPLSAFFLFPGEADQSIGRVLIVLTGIALFVRPRRPIRWFWFALAICPLILSLGPDVQIGGVLIPLPYRIIHQLLSGLYRWPSRFAPMGTLALLIFVGLSLRPRRRNVLTVALTLLILADGHALAPFPVQPPIKDYAIYHQIGQETDQYVVLFVPVTAHSGWAEVGGDQGQRAQYLQIYHHKPQINGSLSRIPDIEHTLYEQPPLFSFLSGTHEFIQNQPPFDPVAASQEMSKWIREWPIGYVTVHLAWLSPDRVMPILGFLNAQSDLCFVRQEEDVLAYRARSRGCPDLTPTGAATIDFGQPGDEPYLVAGLYPRELIGGVSARWSRTVTEVKVQVKPGRGYRLTFRALGYGDGRRLTVYANGHNLGNLALTNDWATYTLSILPDQLDSSGVILLRFEANGEISPAARSGSADQRLLSVAFASLSLNP